MRALAPSFISVSHNDMDFNTFVLGCQTRQLRRLKIFSLSATLNNVIEIKPFFVVTGNLKIEGGETTHIEHSSEDPSGKSTQVRQRQKSPMRPRGASMVVQASRKLLALSVLRTPYGVLVDPSEGKNVQKLLMTLTREAREFNAESPDCRVTNYYLLEGLTGPRKAAVEGWIAKQKAAGDPEIKDLLPKLLTD